MHIVAKIFITELIALACLFWVDMTTDKISERISAFLFNATMVSLIFTILYALWILF